MTTNSDLLAELDRLRQQNAELLAQGQRQQQQYDTEFARLRQEMAQQPVARLAPAMPMQEPNRSTLRIPDPVPFKGTRGEDARAWLFTMQSKLDLERETDDARRILYTGCRLTDAASTWFQKVMGEEANTTWDEFVRAFLVEFTPADEAKLARAVLTSTTFRQTGAYEGVREYIAKFRELVMKVPSTDFSQTVLIERFLRGLKSPIQKQLFSVDISTLKQAFQLAETSERTFLDNRAAQGQTTPMDLGAMERQSGANKGTRDGGGRGSGRAPGHKYPPIDWGDATPELRTERRAKNLCMKCGQADHKFFHCPHARGQGNGQNPAQGGR